MSSHSKNHSKTHKYLFFAAIAITVLALVWSYLLGGSQIKRQKLSLNMTIKDAARLYSMRPRTLAAELGLNEPVSKRIPIKELGISRKNLLEVERYLSLRKENKKVLLVYILATFWGALYLMYIWRPTLNINNKSSWRFRRGAYIAVLSLVVVLGFIHGKSPNPMQSVSEMFKAFAGFYPVVYDKILVFGFFIILSVIVNKIVCGWACPFGALQELIFSWPILKEIKNKKVPFIFSNGIRITLFALMLVFLFGGIGVRGGRSLYHGVNVFNLFDLRFDEPTIILTIIVTLSASLFLYRPFCNYICPFGLISWFFERLSIFKITIDKSKCINCGKCENACPTHAAGNYLRNKKMPADCFSCARCLVVCPANAIKYKFGFGKKLRSQSNQGRTIGPGEIRDGADECEG